MERTRLETRRQPRISAAKLGEYLTAGPTRRRGITDWQAVTGGGSGSATMAVGDAAQPLQCSLQGWNSAC